MQEESSFGFTPSNFGAIAVVVGGAFAAVIYGVPYFDESHVVESLNRSVAAYENLLKIGKAHPAVQRACLDIVEEYNSNTWRVPTRTLAVYELPPFLSKTECNFGVQSSSLMVR
jgi:hypothetical protein